MLNQEENDKRNWTLTFLSSVNHGSPPLHSYTNKHKWKSANLWWKTQENKPERPELSYEVLLTCVLKTFTWWSGFSARIRVREICAEFFPPPAEVTDQFSVQQFEQRRSGFSDSCFGLRAGHRPGAKIRHPPRAQEVKQTNYPMKWKAAKWL